MEEDKNRIKNEMSESEAVKLEHKQITRKSMKDSRTIKKESPHPIPPHFQKNLLQPITSDFPRIYVYVIIVLVCVFIVLSLIIFILWESDSDPSDENEGSEEKNAVRTAQTLVIYTSPYPGGAPSLCQETKVRGVPHRCDDSFPYEWCTGNRN